MVGTGGARPGAGRKPNAEKYKRQIAKATDTMGRMLPEAAAATVDLATGIFVLMTLDTRSGEWVKAKTEAVANAAIDAGLFRVYREPPDIRAIGIMFDRLMGKVAQPIDVRHQLAIENVTEAQQILMRVLEEHVPGEYLAPIRAELARVAELHSGARTAVGID